MSSSTATLPRRPVLADSLPGAWTRDVALVLAGAAFMVLMTQIAIPVPPSPVPITGQTLAVVVCGAALGAVRGSLAMLLWAAVGLFLPVYSDGGSGLQHLTGATGGYILGFIVAAYVVGKLAERGADRHVLLAFAAFVAGQAIVFGFGVPWLKVAADMEWSVAFHDGFALFVVGGLIKAAVAAAVLPSAWALARKVDGTSTLDRRDG
jgi:biotin transport system substrate-specific component